MSKSKYLFLLFICLSASISIRAQFMDYGSDPARFKWNIVRLPHYNLVYPQGTSSCQYAVQRYGIVGSPPDGTYHDSFFRSGSSEVG